MRKINTLIYHLVRLSLSVLEDDQHLTASIQDFIVELVDWTGIMDIWVYDLDNYSLQF